MTTQVKVAWIGGAAIVVAALFTGIFSIWNNSDGKSSASKTTIQTVDTNVKPINSTNIISQTPIINNINRDSTRQTINQITQNNSNNGDVKNEFISGDKIVNQNTIVVNPKPEKPKPRIVTNADIKQIEEKVPKNYNISLMYSFSDKECNDYGNQLNDKLTSIGYTVQGMLYGQLMGGGYNERFNISLKDDKQMADITIYVLREK